MAIFDFTGKVALITGASRGLGFSLAKKLAQRGAHIIAVARTSGGLEDLDTIIQKGGGTATLVPLDLTDDDGIARMGRAIYDRWGKLDILVHAAAEGAPLSPAAHTAIKDFDKAMQINARAVHQIIRCCDPLLGLSEDSIAIFMTDDQAGEKFWTAYGASKAAGAAIARSYATEVIGSAHCVALCQPPAMPTGLRARAFPGEDRVGLAKTDDIADQIIECIENRDFKHGECLKIQGRVN